MINPLRDDIMDFSNWDGQANKYDLIILDRVWDQHQSTANKILNNGLRLQILETTYQNLTKNGQIICLADNKLNLKKPWEFLSAIIKYIIRTDVSPLRKDFQKDLKKAGYSRRKCFFLFPDVAGFNRIISTNKRPILDFTIKSHNLPHKRPKQFSRWPKWLLVKFGIDAWLMTNHLYWGRK